MPKLHVRQVQLAKECFCPTQAQFPLDTHVFQLSKKDEHERTCTVRNNATSLRKPRGDGG